MSLYKLPLRRKREYLGLDKIPVWYEDYTSDSKKIFGLSTVPEEFCAGKNVIKILGTENLEYLTEVNIEILDSTGSPIYWEIPDYVDFAKRRSIIVWIYPETPTGLGSITLTGILKDSDVPLEWRNVTNVRWRKDIEVDSTSPNKGEIAFGKKPTISIEEKFKQVSRPQFSGGSNSPVSTVINNIKYRTEKTSQGPIDNVVTYDDAAKKYRDSTSDKNIWTTWNENSISTEKGLKNISNFERDFSKAQYYSPLVKRVNKSKLKAGAGGATLTLDTESFLPEMEGGEIAYVTATITDRVFSPVSQKAGASLSGTQRTKIVQVINSNTVRVEDTIKDTLGNALISCNIGTLAIEYTPSPDDYITSEKYQNFARFKMYNVNPVSGDVYKIKLYTRNQESQDNKFELVTDRILEPVNLLVDREVQIENLEIGALPTSSLVTSYWSASSHQNGSQPASTGVFARYGSSNLNKGIAVSSSQANGTINTGFAKLQPVSGSSIFSIDSYSSSSYIFEFDLFGETVQSNFETDGVVYICLSGSAIENRPKNNVESQMFDDVSFKGQVLHKISINDRTKTVNGKILIDDSALTFQPDIDGKVTPIFIMQGGKWAFSEIRLKPYAEAGFTPSHLEFDLPIPPTFDGTEMDFKVEFLDYLGNVSKEIAYVNNISFANGSQIFQQGDKNINVGKQTFGTDLASGIVIETAENPESASTFGTVIKSAGFKTYAEAQAGTAPAGWMFNSGSVSGSNEKGATFELASPSASFRFSSDPSDPDEGLQIVATTIESNTIIISGSTTGLTSSFWTGSNDDGSIHRDSDVYITGSLFIENPPGSGALTISSSFSSLASEPYNYISLNAGTNGGGILLRAEGLEKKIRLWSGGGSAAATGRFELFSTDLYVSSSHVSSSVMSASIFSGSFVGDGSGLTGISGGSGFPFTGDAQITGSLLLDGGPGGGVYVTQSNEVFFDLNDGYFWQKPGSGNPTYLVRYSANTTTPSFLNTYGLRVQNTFAALEYNSTIDSDGGVSYITNRQMSVCSASESSLTDSELSPSIKMWDRNYPALTGSRIESSGSWNVSGSVNMDGDIIMYNGLLDVGPTTVANGPRIALYYDTPSNNIASFQRCGNSSNQQRGRLVLKDLLSGNVGYQTVNLQGSGSSFISGGNLLLGSTFEYGDLSTYLFELDDDNAGKPTSNTWTITSDERLKEDIVTASIDICYNGVKNIPLKYFGYREEFSKSPLHDQHKIGWIAQDVESVFPKAVTAGKFTTWSTYTGSVSITGSPIEGNDGEFRMLHPGKRYQDPFAGSTVIDDRKSLDADQMIKMMYGAIQKLQQKVEALEAQISGSN